MQTHKDNKVLYNRYVTDIINPILQVQKWRYKLDSENWMPSSFFKSLVVASAGSYSPKYSPVSPVDRMVLDARLALTACSWAFWSLVYDCPTIYGGQEEHPPMHEVHSKVNKELWDP